MILTEKEINNMPVNLGTLWIIKKSHIEALDKIKELDPYYYISKWEYYEDRADRLAVIADTLAEEIEASKIWNRWTESFGLKSCPAEFSETADKLFYEEESGMSEWKPIETAPKDGTSYLATNGKKYAALNEPPGFAKGYWEKFGKQWVGYAEMKFEPTYWRPLPELQGE